jgi:ATP-dependent DNA ligase
MFGVRCRFLIESKFDGERIHLHWSRTPDDETMQNVP